MSIEVIRHDAEVSPASMFPSGDMLYVLRAYDEYRERALRAEMAERNLSDTLSEWRRAVSE